MGKKIAEHFLTGRFPRFEIDQAVIPVVILKFAFQIDLSQFREKLVTDDFELGTGQGQFPPFGSSEGQISHSARSQNAVD